MKLLEEGQESVRPEKCELNEPLDHERVSFRLLEPPPTLKTLLNDWFDTCLVSNNLEDILAYLIKF